MEPLVSILIPAYNAEEWISDTIRSAVSQTWPNKEIVVVDDGSTDGTLAIARRFESRNVLVVTQENGGGAAARNTAFSRCQGDYIQWLDADDLLAPDKISKQMQAAKEGARAGTLLSSAWGYFMYRPSAAKFAPTALWCDLLPVEWMLRKWEQNLHMQTATWLVSRTLTETAGPWNTTLLGDDDGEYFARVVLASDGIRFVPDARVYYRVVGTGRLSYIGRSSRKIEAQFASMGLQIGYVRALRDDERVRRAAIKYLENWLPNFHPERPDVVQKARTMASALGGTLELPGIPWKYALIDRVLGRSAAKRAQLKYNQCKTRLMRMWDRVLFSLPGSQSERAGQSIR